MRLFIPLEAEHPAVSATEMNPVRSRDCISQSASNGINARFPTAHAGFNTPRELLTGSI